MRETGKVLIIEDDDEDFRIVRALLRQAGASMLTLEHQPTLRGGLNAIATDTDVVLLDLNLPDAQGFDTFRQVRELAPHIPIVLLTGLHDEALGMQAIQGGAQDYLVKGEFDGHLLLRTILYAIERKASHERLQHLADQLVATNTIMAQDLAMARDIQQALMPLSLNALPHVRSGQTIRMGSLYRPCESLGGDFYTALPLSSDTVAVLVCDVVGHGVRSALITAVLRGLMEDAKHAAQDPGQLLTQINRTLPRVLTLPDLILITAVCVFVDHHQPRLRVASAGHPPPLRIDAAGAAMWLANPTRNPDPALGLTPRMTYGTATFDLAPGDRLLLYTDGIPEACNPEGEAYGRERMQACVMAARDMAIEDVPAHLLRDAQAFTERDDFKDDICLVAIERAGAPAARGAPTP